MAKKKSKPTAPPGPPSQGALVQAAAMEGDVEALRALRDAGAWLGAPKEDDACAITPLFWVSGRESSMPCLELLLESGVDVDARISESDHTPLMHAAGSGNQKGLLRLLAGGADAKLTCANSGTALSIAAWSFKGDVEIKALLAAGAEPDGVGSWKSSPLAQAIRRRNDVGAMALALAGAHVQEKARWGHPSVFRTLSEVAREMDMPEFASLCVAKSEARALGKRRRGALKIGGSSRPRI